MSDNGGDERLWEAYFAVAFLLVLGFIAGVEHRQPVAERIAATGLLVLMAAWYLWLGRRIVRGGTVTWRNYAFQGGLLAMYLPAVVLVHSTSFILLALCPLAYMSLRLVAASVVVVVASLALPGVHFASTGDVRQTLSGPLPVALATIAFSTVIAVAIIRAERRSAERAELIENLTTARAEVARLSREAGIAEERQRLAGEIHDTVAQGLSSVVMLVQAADAALETDLTTVRTHLSLAARTARENLDEARAMVGALTPAPLTEASLVDALGRLCDRFTAESGVPAVLSVDGPARALPTGAEVVLLRVVQEALTNVRKHSGAREAVVRLAFSDAGAAVRVRDDGCGFDVDAMPTGYGLDAMRSRVEQVGGRFSIRSGAIDGTTIDAEIEA